jgi:colanic acid biosynthesis glycosyl transferase WcaI
MRILIYSYNYYPEPIGIAPLMTELAEGLVQRGHQVRVVTAMPNYPQRCIYKDYRGKLFSTTQHNGVLVQRSYVWIKPKPKLIDRLMLDASFIVTSFSQTLRGWRPDVILTTSPPLPVCIPAMFLKWFYNAPVVLNLQDILPEAAVKVGLLSNKTLIRAFEILEQFAYKSADAISVICEPFVNSLIDKGVPPDKLSVIPNWVNVNFIRPLSKADSLFCKTHNLQDKFVVLYSGNIALTQGLQTAIEAARLLQYLSDIVFVIVGEQSTLAALQHLCLEYNINNVLLLPLQPREQVPQMLAAADVALVLQKCNISSFNLPSKIPVFLASGRAIVASVPSAGTAAQAIQQSKGGVVVPPEDPGSLAKAIESLYHNPTLTKQLAEQGRQYAVNTYSFEKAVSQYEALLAKIVNNRSKMSETSFTIEKDQATGSAVVPEFNALDMTNRRH